MRTENRIRPCWSWLETATCEKVASSRASSPGGGGNAYYCRDLSSVHHL